MAGGPPISNALMFASSNDIIVGDNQERADG